MAKLKQIQIENFKSIGENQVVVNFPENQPVVFIGENNTGKSNITRAIDLIFGEYHPKFKTLDDHDHFGRDKNNNIVIRAETSDLQGRLGRTGEFGCIGFYFEAQNGNSEFQAIQDDGGHNPYVKNELRKEIESIVVNAERNLSYQLSYASKFTLLSKVTKSFHQTLIQDEEKIERLKTLFNQIKETFLEVEEFSEFKRNMSNIADDVIQNMTYGLELDFSAYDPSNYFKALEVYPSEDGEPRNFDELGTGEQQILALSFAHAYSKSFLADDLILIIDEPESHLHPLAQKWLASQMFNMAEDGLQLILTTHSPYFIDVSYLDGINIVRKNENETEVIAKNPQELYQYCVERNANKEKTNEETIIPFFANHATPNILNGLFANKVILVEGRTEELALPIYLKKIGLNTLKEGVEVIDVGGKGNLAKWWRFFTLYSIPTFVCFDNDQNEDGNGNKRKDALKTIGIPEKEIDNVLSSDTWNIDNSFCAFGADFEDTMRKSFTNYIALEKEAKNELGSSKHIVARKVANDLEFNEDEEGWQCFSELGEKINMLS